MQKTVILHIGRPKTGTTSIQQFLCGRRPALRDAGIVYPGVRDHPLFGARHNHVAVVPAFKGFANDPIQGYGVVQCREAVDSVLDKFRSSAARTLILSHESLARPSIWDKDYVADCLSGFEIRVLLSTRFMAEWIESWTRNSMWAAINRASGLQMHRILSRRFLLEPGKYSVRAIARGIETVLPRAALDVWSFDDSKARRSVVRDALGAMNIPLEASEEVVQQLAPPPSQLRLLCDLSAGGFEPADIRMLSRTMMKMVREDIAFPPLDEGQYGFMTRKQVRTARRIYEKDRQAFPQLPPLPENGPGHRTLARDDALAILSVLRSAISDDLFVRAAGTLDHAGRAVSRGGRPKTKRGRVRLTPPQRRRRERKRLQQTEAESAIG